MRLLLDTHLLIWASIDSRRLPAEAKTLIQNPENVIFFSVASIWEMAIKAARLQSQLDLDLTETRLQLLANGYNELPVTGVHAIVVAGLPEIHKDPFDRLLVAQAIVEQATLLTVDRMIALYPAPVLKF